MPPVFNICNNFMIQIVGCMKELNWQVRQNVYPFFSDYSIILEKLTCVSILETY